MRVSFCALIEIIAEDFMSFATYVATHSNESLIRDGLRQLDCSIAFLCAVTDGAPSSSMVSLWLAGKKNLDDSDTKPLAEMIRTLREITALAAPWPLNFRNNAQLWKTLLADYRRKEQ
jgi:hypothetical protein